MFRSYGHGDLTASIWAGLAAHDSLILLDEAHCAVPFLQTLQAINRFRGAPSQPEKWVEEPIITPFHFTVLSATPPSKLISPEKRFPKNDDERQQALDHENLQQRFRAVKPTALVIVKRSKGPANQFVVEAAREAREFISTRGKRSVAVMVNRVATAAEIAEALRKQVQEKADVVLLTGRMRSLDRDDMSSQ